MIYSNNAEKAAILETGLEAFRKRDRKVEKVCLSFKFY